MEKYKIIDRLYYIILFVSSGSISRITILYITLHHRKHYIYIYIMPHAYTLQSTIASTIFKIKFLNFVQKFISINTNAYSEHSFIHSRSITTTDVYINLFFFFFFNFKNTLHFWYSTHFSLIHHLEIVSSSCFEQFSVLHEYLPMFLITHPSRLLIPIPRTPVESSEFHRFHGFNTVFEIFRGVLPFPPTWKNQLFVLSRVFFFVFLLFFCDDTCKKYIYV